MLRAAFIVLLFALLPSPLQAEGRIALLIGNKDYKPGVGALVNPLNDIRVVGEALKSVGFEVMKPAQNVQRADMLRALYQFAAKLKSAGPDAVGFLYYSGHGIASAGENYLIPVDVNEPSTVELSVQGVKQSEVLAILRNEAPNAAHYLVLDACRNTLQGARGGKGFLPVGQQSGVLVAFATEPGKTASDAGQSNGPYAAALAAELVKPGQNDLLMFHRVRVAVMDKTNGDQVPWTEDGIQRRERVMFGGENGPAPSTQVVPQGSEAERAWAAAKDTNSVAVLEDFALRYKDSFYAGLARARIEELKKQKIAAALPPKTPTAPPTIQTTPAIVRPPMRNDYPSRQVTVVVPFAAGGPTDTVTRIVADHMARTLSQPVVIENITGAGGATGSARVAASSPDGYTLLTGSMGTHVAAPVLTPSVSYDPIQSFEPVGFMTRDPAVIVARKDFPAKDLREFVDYVRKNGGKVSQAHGGIGSPSHLACLLFTSEAGLRPTQIAYLGAAPAMNDLMGGVVDFMCEQAASTAPKIKAGAIKAYGVSSTTRIAALPNVPTAQEGGVNYQMSVWTGIFAPKGTGQEIVTKLAAALDEALDDPGVQKRLADLFGSSTPAGEERTPAKFESYVKSEIARWVPILKAASP